VQVKDAREHPRLAGIEVGEVPGAVDDHLQVIGRVALLEVVGVDAEEADDRVGDPGQGQGEGCAEDAKPLQGTRHPSRRGLGPADRQHLRHLLTYGDVQAGGQCEGKRQRERHRDSVRKAAEHRLQQTRQRRLAQEADPDRGHRDPDLAGRKRLVDVIELLEHELSARRILLGELLEPAAARAHQRELRGDEEAIHRDQHEQQNQ
jgi:hypothetical protein